MLSKINGTTICGMEISPPLMNASGVMSGSPRILDEWVRAGCGGVTTKTILAEPKQPNYFNYHLESREKPELITIRMMKDTINTHGLPGHGVEWWCNHLPRMKFVHRKKDREVLINASVGTARGRLDDYAAIAMKMEPMASMLEMNVSCPNTEHAVIGHDIASMKTLLKTVKTSKPLGFKLPCYYVEESKRRFKLEPDEIGKYFLKEDVFVDIPTRIDKERLREILELLERYGVDFVTSINTIPVSHPMLSRAVGGLSGWLIHWLATEQATLIDKYSDLEIMGVGGVMDANGVKDFLSIKNVKVVQLGSGVFQTDLPHLFVNRILGELGYEW